MKCESRAHPRTFWRVHPPPHKPSFFKRHGMDSLNSPCVALRAETREVRTPLFLVSHLLRRPLGRAWTPAGAPAPALDACDVGQLGYNRRFSPMMGHWTVASSRRLVSPLLIGAPWGRGNAPTRGSPAAGRGAPGSRLAAGICLVCC